MKIQTKTALILIGTLLIGVVIGVLGSGFAMRWMTKKFADRPFSARFAGVYERIIGPDDANRDTVLAILEKHAGLIEEFRQSHDATMKAYMDSLKAELDPLLTPEQKQRLTELHERMRERFEHFRHRPGAGRPGKFPGDQPPPPFPGDEPPPPPGDSGK